MPDYRRKYQPGGTYFFTVVTNLRKPIFASPNAVDLFQTEWQKVKSVLPFETIAYCILPDHIHCIWALPEGDHNFSQRWQMIKANFSRSFRNKGSINIQISESKIKKRESGIWERRFWEHLIRDPEDLNRHIDYIHFNPLKHRLVNDLVKWKYSSFSQYLKDGSYDANWGKEEPLRIKGLLDLE